MSTRANVVVKDANKQLWFYRHSDGYPEGAMPTLQKFMAWVRSGKIRDYPSQAAGWLILIGAAEYDTHYTVEGSKKKPTVLEPMDDPMSGWKCGAYEPTTGVHGDIEFLYELDLTTKTITCFRRWDEDGNGTGEPYFVDSPEKPWEMPEDDEQ